MTDCQISDDDFQLGNKTVTQPQTCRSTLSSSVSLPAKCKGFTQARTHTQTRTRMLELLALNFKLSSLSSQLSLPLTSPLSVTLQNGKISSNSAVSHQVIQSVNNKLLLV